MKPILAILYSLVLSIAAYGEITIQEAGLDNNVARGANNVKVKITNPSAAQDFTVQLSWGSETNGFEYKVHLAAAETKTLDLPVIFFGSGKLFARQINRDGVVVSSSEKLLVESGSLVAVVCNSDPVCASTAQAIRDASTIEERNERERLQIILLEDPPQTWLAYSPAKTVVVAGGIPNSAVRQAITDYGRGGGRIVVAMDQAPKDFLADYRGSGSGEVALGRGVVLFVAHAAGPNMQDAFSEPRPKSPEPIALTNLVFSSELGAPWLLERSAMRFEFPHLGWLIGSMSAYILIIGLVNFMVLRRIRKVELAWITVPALALLAGTIFYYFGTRGKVHEFVLDEASVCAMDDKSPRAAVANALRISSPRVQNIVVKVAGSSVLTSSSNDPLFRASEAADIWDKRKPARFSHPPDMTVDSDKHLPLEMLRYSFRNLEWESYRDFAGTVAFQGRRLKNATGQNFRQAVLADFKKHEFYDLGAVSNGSEIDPFRNAPQPMRGVRIDGKPNGAFDLRESIATWSLYVTQPGDCLVFVGLSDQPLLQAQLEGMPFVRKVNTLFTVKVSRPR